jgi:hypothetical protein
MMKTLLAASILAFGTLSWAQAPRCSSVLSLSAVAASKIEDIIANLAQMKLNLDLALSRGGQSVQSRNLKNIYASKVQELREHIGHQISDSQIRDLIVDKIKSLQGLHAEAISDEYQSREKMKEGFKIKEKMIDIDYFDGIIDDLHYLKELDSVFSISNESNSPWLGVLSILNLKTEENRVVDLKATYTKVSDKGQIFFFRHEEYKSYDIANDKITNIGKLSQPLTGLDWLDLSPSFEWTSIRNQEEIRFENIRTGQKGFTFKNPQRKRWFHAFSGKNYRDNILMGSLFLNDSEVLVSTRSWHTGKDENAFFTFNFKTGVTTEIDTKGFELKNLTLQPETQTLYFTMEGTLGEIKYSDLGNFKTRVILHDLDSGDIKHIKFTPNGDALFIATTNPQDGMPIEFYAPPHNLPTNPNHFTRMSENPLRVDKAPAFDMDNHRIFIGRVGYDETHDKSVYFLEVKGLKNVQ